MQRAIITADELKAHLTVELQKIQDLERCSVDGIMPLQSPDENGCNWSDNVTVRSGREVPVDFFIPDVRRIVADAQRRFNLREED
jgi:hypothetical protein